MTSKLKYLLTLPITYAMTQELAKADPSAETVSRCLLMGADPMARLPNGASAFYTISLKLPLSIAMDSWFRAVDGDLRDWPWNKAATPLDDVLPHTGPTAQPSGYTLRLLKDLHGAGLDIASLDTPEHPLVERVYHTHAPNAYPVMLFLAESYPEHAFHLSKKALELLQDDGFPVEKLTPPSSPSAPQRPRP